MPADDTDEQLLSRFARGDTDALGTLAQRYETALFGLARGLLSQRDDLARDAVQDSWVRVIRAAAHFRSQSSVRTWLYRIVVNRCHDLRAKVRPQAALNGVHHSSEARPASPDFELHRALDTLPAADRLILLLCHHRGLTHEQAADVLGIPVGTLKSRQHAAMRTLRAKLAGKDDAE